MNDKLAICELIESYFSGLHRGDTALLESIFHPDCMLKAPGLRRSLSQWLEHVQQRAVPAHSGHPWDYEILALDIEGEQALAKLNCPLPHGHFIDFLGLLRERDQWRIVNKMYATKTETQNENPEN